MRNSLLSILALAIVAGAVVPNKFSSGKPVIAQDVNDNFAYLDTSAATKSDLKALQAKQRTDSAALAASAANGLSMATVNSNLAGLRDTVGKKKDSAWIMKAVTPAAIGALPVSNGSASLSGALTVGSMISAGGFQTGGSLSAKSASVDSIGTSGLRFTSPGYQRQVVIGAFDSYSPNPLTHGLYVPALINSSIRFIADATSTTAFLSRSRSDGSWPQDLISVNTDGLSKNQLVLGSDVSVTGDLKASSLLSNAGVGGKSVGLNKGASDIVGSGSFIQFNDSLSKTQQAWILQLGASNTLDFWNFANGTWTGNKPLIQFLPTGTVKTASLDVGGDIQVAGTLKTAPGSVKSSDVADYVFEPSYKLATLSEVEAFAKEHKHLPEVPSATEIERRGMDLAQMNLVLLKKVEELTLHAIEQQKAIEQQRQEMAQVKAELKSLKRD